MVVIGIPSVGIGSGTITKAPKLSAKSSDSLRGHNVVEEGVPNSVQMQLRLEVAVRVRRSISVMQVAIGCSDFYSRG